VSNVFVHDKFGPSECLGLRDHRTGCKEGPTNRKSTTGRVGKRAYVAENMDPSGSTAAVDCHCCMGVPVLSLEYRGKSRPKIRASPVTSRFRGHFVPCHPSVFRRNNVTNPQQRFSIPCICNSFNVARGKSLAHFLAVSGSNGNRSS
jgi:hypothetical protein